jgi:hypothetical protein
VEMGSLKQFLKTHTIDLRATAHILSNIAAGMVHISSVIYDLKLLGLTFQVENYPQRFSGEKYSS